MPHPSSVSSLLISADHPSKVRRVGSPKSGDRLAHLAMSTVPRAAVELFCGGPVSARGGLDCLTTTFAFKAVWMIHELSFIDRQGPSYCTASKQP